jgi:transcriptional regulator with XRE-family HTH domain
MSPRGYCGGGFWVSGRPYGGVVLELPVFGVQVRRLAELRGMDVREVAERAGVPGAEAVAVSGDAQLDPSLLRRLAPVLGMDASDLFIIAGRPVPEDLAPLDAAARTVVDGLAWSLTYLPHAVPELRRHVRSMPQLSRPGPPPPVPSYWQYPNGAGALVMRLLHNRNLGWLGCAKYLFGLGGGPMLSAATMGAIGHDRKALTPELLAGFCAFLNIPRADLSALTDVPLAGSVQAAHPDAPEAAALIWDARRLTAGQMRQVRNRADKLRPERSQDHRT